MKLLNRQGERRIANAVLADPEEHTVMDKGGAVRSIQAANVDMPEGELLELWKPVNLERLARTYWKYLSRVTLGIIRVTYTEEERAVVVIGRPLVLLRFHAPEYDISGDRGIVQWEIKDGLLVSKRNEGYLEIDVKRMESDRQGYARVHVEVEIANFYPAIATWVARWVYVQTQSRIHVLVTHGFLRSLARLELEKSAVGRFSEDGAQRRRQRRRHALAGRGRAHADRRSARVIPATSTSASREEGLAPMELMKPWKRPAEAAHEHLHARLAQRLRVGLALVAQRVEAGGDHQRRRRLAEPR